MKVSERLSRENGRDYALRVIKDNIIHLNLEPGSQVSENELSAELGLSRTPVREALIELAKVKIIEIQPQKRSVVRLIDYDLVEESRFMRNILECAVVELVCEMIKPEDVERLRENVRLQKFYLDSFYPENLMDLDNKFHQTLFEIARKSQVFSLMQNISIHFDRVRSIALSTVKDLKIVQDHEDITNAIARKDPAAARELMETHLSRYKIDAQAIRKTYPQYFPKNA
ncbi:MAG: GntR family transcriptional regulator [Dysosmobacter sp.]|nr:GntR family transcriptional regulator [Dysosmobacter sp.]